MCSSKTDRKGDQTNPNTAGQPISNLTNQNLKDQDRKSYLATDWQNLISNENLKESSLRNIDNALWQDTKNEIAVYNAKEAVDL